MSESSEGNNDEKDGKSLSNKRGSKLSPGAMAAFLLFAGFAGYAFYSFVDMARHSEQRRACEPLVQLRPHYLGADRTAPDFDLPMMDGRRMRLSDYRGKVVLLHFWTKTCPPCLEELPAIAELAETLKKRNDVVLLTVTIDDGPKEIEDTLKAVLGGKANFPIAFDPDSQMVRGKFGTKLFPETWFIDPEGRVRLRLDGVPRAGERCDVAWKTALVHSAIDALKSPTPCNIRIDSKEPQNPTLMRCGGG